MSIKTLWIWPILFASNYAFSDDIQAVDTTHIRASKELPKVLYVVPWKDINKTESAEQKLVLHNFFGDLYDPVLPDKMQPTLKENDTIEPAKIIPQEKTL